MADGLNVRFLTSPLDFFQQDETGFFSPMPESIKLGQTEQRLKRQLNAETGVWKEASRKAVSTEIASDNPAGNSQVISAGWVLHGPPIISPPKGISAQRQGVKPTQAQIKALQKRQRSFYDEQQALLNLVDSLKPDPGSNPRKYAQWLFERHQATTGMAFDNNEFGDVTRSVMTGLVKGLQGTIECELTPEMKALIVKHSYLLKEEIASLGIAYGSLSPYGATLMKGLQDNDGLIPMPVFSHAFDPLTTEKAKALLIETDGGCNLKNKVGTTVQGLHGEGPRKYSTVDAAADILDTVVLSPSMLLPIVTILERIQKTGIKENEGFDAPWGIHYSFRQKDGKARSVNPISLIPAILEGMVFAAFNDAIKEKGFKLMPSLQNPETRRDMTSSYIKAVLDSGDQPFDLDFSGYDKTLLMSIMVTIVQIAVKPFFHSKWHDLVDAACFIITYKLYMVDGQFVKRWAGKEDEWLRRHSSVFSAGGFNFYFTWSSWPSGIKFTHVGGSLYGRVVPHGAMYELALSYLGVRPKTLSYPTPGLMAGDDFLGRWLSDLVKDGISAKDALDALKRAATAFNLEFNEGKLWWEFFQGEKLNIFLQDLYHIATGNFGVGSAFRGAAAWCVVERNKNLKVNEQEVQVVSKMVQGANSDFIDDALRFVLERDRFLAYVFRVYRHNGLRALIGTSEPQEVRELANKIGVDAYHWGWSADDLLQAKCPILENLIRVSDEVQASIEDLPEEAVLYLQGLEMQPIGETEDGVETSSGDHEMTE